MTVIDRLVGQSVTNHRARLGMTRAALAHHLSLTATDVQTLELGQSQFSVQQLYDMAALVGITLDRFWADASPLCSIANLMSPPPERERDAIARHYASLTNMHRSAIFAFISTLGRDPNEELM